MQALIRADADEVIGLGHLMRCMTLADELVRCGVEVTFLVNSDLASELLTQRRFVHERLTGPRPSLDDVQRIEAAVGTDFIVVDGYDFDDHFIGELNKRVFTCTIDDLGRSPPCSMLVNPNPYASELYETPPPNALLGASYALIRNEFREARFKARAPAGNRGRLLITFGGADPRDFTSRSLRLLDEFAPTLEIRVILGRARGPSLQLDHAVAGSPHSVEILRDIPNMGEQFLWCDVAIGAAGTTCLEMACVGVPGLILVTADNQRRAAAYFRREALFDVVDSLDKAVERLRALMTSTARQDTMRSIQRNTIDGNGAARVARALAHASK